MREDYIRERLVEGIFIFFITLLAPYLITMALTGKDTNIASKKIAKGDKTITIISDETTEELGIDQYIVGVIPYYMPSNFEDEAFKVQAVLIRTYIEKKLDGVSSITSGELNLPYMTFEEMRKNWGEDKFATTYKRYEKAVSDTKGEVIMYQGQLIEPFFHNVSVGMTRGKEGYEYLHSAESPNDIQADNYLALSIISKADFIKKLKELYPDYELLEENIVSILTLEASDTSGYINKVKVGDIVMSADLFLENFGLQSLAFTIEEYNDNLRIISRGIGHGLGVSLYGSNQLSLEGKNYIDILNHYYKNIEIIHE
ncbi:MAG: SpoIID/LytB domain-containing protein [Clostridiales bacterium]|nr:SpoIID/LytB domain-containing protein [Clostridiales bacterium]